jgi:hypothetical protein
MVTLDAPRGLGTAERILAAIEDCEPRDQLTGLGWAVVGVLGALRERLENTPDGRKALDRLCSEALEALRWEIEALRFTTAQ